MHLNLKKNWKSFSILLDITSPLALPSTLEQTRYLQQYYSKKVEIQFALGCLLPRAFLSSDIAIIKRYHRFLVFFSGQIPEDCYHEHFCRTIPQCYSDFIVFSFSFQARFPRLDSGIDAAELPRAHLPGDVGSDMLSDARHPWSDAGR